MTSSYWSLKINYNYDYLLEKCLVVVRSKWVPFLCLFCLIELLFIKSYTNMRSCSCLYFDSSSCCHSNEKFQLCFALSKPIDYVRQNHINNLLTHKHRGKFCIFWSNELKIMEALKFLMLVFLKGKLYLKILLSCKLEHLFWRLNFL